MNRGTKRASSLLYVLLHCDGLWNTHPHYQFHRHFLPLLAASWLTLSYRYFGSHRFSKVRGALTETEGSGVSCCSGVWIVRGRWWSAFTVWERGVLGWHAPHAVPCEARFLLQNQENTSHCSYCSPWWTWVLPCLKHALMLKLTKCVLECLRWQNGNWCLLSLSFSWAKPPGEPDPSVWNTAVLLCWSQSGFLGCGRYVHQDFCSHLGDPVVGTSPLPQDSH